MTSHLIVPDSHAHPDYHNRRFKWLGQLIVDLKPDIVIHLGDFADMPSLSSYDKGTRGFEGRRYSKDISCVNDALEKMFTPIRKAKKKLPKFFMLEGNHEYRIKRAVNSDPAQLDGIVSVNDLNYGHFGFEYVPYRGGTPDILTLNGVNYAHFFTSGIMGRPIGGMHPAYQLLTKQYQSCTQGHSHTLDFSQRTKADGQPIQGLVAGVWQDWEADFAGAANDLWWRGLVFKREVDNGNYDPEFISMRAVKKEYA